MSTLFIKMSVSGFSQNCCFVKSFVVSFVEVRKCYATFLLLTRRSHFSKNLFARMVHGRAVMSIWVFGYLRSMYIYVLPVANMNFHQVWVNSISLSLISAVFNTCSSLQWDENSQFKFNYEHRSPYHFLMDTCIKNNTHTQADTLIDCMYDRKESSTVQDWRDLSESVGTEWNLVSMLCLGFSSKQCVFITS